MFVRACALLIVWLTSFSAQATEMVRFFSYHAFPPFFIGENMGLTYDLASYLTQKSNGVYQMVVDIVPRRRLDMLMQDGEPLVIPWVSPEWYGPRAMERYAWTDSLFEDRNVVISSTAMPIDYTGPHSLSGKRIGTVIGHVYTDLQPLMDSRTIIREDSINEEVNVRKVALGRVDAAVMAESAARYYIQAFGLGSRIYISQEPHSSFRRHIMISGRNFILAEYLRYAIANLHNDPDWLAIWARW